MSTFVVMFFFIFLDRFGREMLIIVKDNRPIRMSETVNKSDISNALDSQKTAYALGPLHTIK